MAKKIFILVLLIFTLASFSAFCADIQSSVSLGFTYYNSDGTVSFPYATVTGSKVSTVTVSVVDKKGSFANLSNYLITDLADSSGNHYCATFKVSNAAAAQTLIRGLKFKNTTADVSVIKVSIDGNTTNISSDANLTEYNGHYYIYVSGKMSWSKAYNAAKSLYFQGMQGYLATLTSKAEKTLLSNISTQCAWIGGTVIAYNNTNKTKILDASSLTIKKGNFTYMNGPSWPSSSNTGNNATALKYYYWACGPEAGQTCNSNSEIFTSSGEPNVYSLVSSSIDTSTANNTLNLTSWETCLVANNNGDPQVINDINESGRIGSHNAGYFVEFGGYTTDPGKPSSTYKASTSATVSHQHKWSYSASGTTITAKCSVSGCTYKTTGQTVSISAPDLVHIGVTYTPFTYSSSATTWSQLGIAAVSAKYTGRNSTSYSSTTAPKTLGEYTMTLTCSGKSVTKNFEVNHLWSYSKSGDAIVAKCTKSGCTYNTSPISLKIAVPDFIHVGDSYTELTNESTWKSNGCAAITKLYTGTMEESAYSSSTAPKKRGNYTFKVTASSLSLTKDFEINHVWTYSKNQFSLFANCTDDDCQYHDTPVSVTLATNLANLELGMTPSNLSDPSILWKSSDPTVATVDENGRIFALKEGSTTITATSAAGGGNIASMVISVTKDGINIPEIKEDSKENSSDAVYNSAYKITAASTETGKSYSSAISDSIALLVDTSASVSITNPTVNKTGSSSGGDNCNFYGQNAAVLVKGGSTTTITGGTVTSSASGANGVFSYGGNGGTNGAAGDGTTVIISNTEITTSGSGSGGIMTTGGGVMNASNLKVTTNGNSSAAIRTDRGGGTVTVDGGTYTSNGLGSPAIYSTADITVSNATLKSTQSEGVCIEGKNSVELNNCSLTVTNSKCNGNAQFLDSVMIYQSMSGDAASGNSTFTMNGGTLTSNNGHVFHVTNTTAQIDLTNVTVINNDSDNVLLSVCDDGWSGASNVATLNASNQTLTGTILVGSDSTFTLNLKNGSSFTGSFSGAITNENGTAVSSSLGSVTINVDSGCTCTLTGDTTGITVNNN